MTCRTRQVVKSLSPIPSILQHLHSFSVVLHIAEGKKGRKNIYKANFIHTSIIVSKRNLRHSNSINMNKLEFVHCKPSTCIICMLFISTIFASIQFKIESRRGFCIAEDIKTQMITLKNCGRCYE